MNIRQFESQYAALKVLSVNRKMKNDDMFLTFKKRQNIVTENSPASWAEIVHFLKQDLLNAFVGDFLEDARNYNDYELEKLFVLLEHNQELFRIKELARDFLVLAKELTEREDSGWNTQIEAALYSPNMSKQLESGLLCLKFPFADLMAAKVKYALASPALITDCLSTGCRRLKNRSRWRLPKFIRSWRMCSFRQTAFVRKPRNFMQCIIF